MNEIALRSEDARVLDLRENFRMTSVGLDIIGRPDFDECAWVGKRLPVVEDKWPFALGDFILYVEMTFGEKAAQIIDAGDGWKESTCKVYRWICSRIAPKDRHGDLTFKHHMKVAALAPAEQRRWLAEASAGDWTVARLEAAIKEGNDAPIIGWALVVKCESVERRDVAVTLLESKGFIVKVNERRGRVPKKKKAKKTVTARAKRSGKRRKMVNGSGASA